MQKFILSTRWCCCLPAVVSSSDKKTAGAELQTGQLVQAQTSEIIWSPNQAQKYPKVKLGLRNLLWRHKSTYADK